MNKLKQCLKQYTRLKEPTKICKICFNNFPSNSLRTILGKDLSICNKCFKAFNPKFHHFTIDNIKGLSIYDYDERMKSLIYQLKGCFDVELAKIFLEQYLFYLKIKYAGYVIVPIPSNKVDDDKREFNHVIEIFKYLNLPTYNVLYKSEKYKQSDQKASDRHLIEKYLKMSDTKSLINKKILLVDDIVTTGSTLRAAIKLLSNIKVKDIKILVVAKTMSHS